MEPLSLLEIRKRLQKWAIGIHARYGHPVYLVGSVLNADVRYPRDIDVRVIISNKEYFNRFGNMTSNIDRRMRWAEEMGKQNYIAVMECLLPIDFQIQSTKHVAFLDAIKNPRVRLDVGSVV